MFQELNQQSEMKRKLLFIGLLTALLVIGLDSCKKESEAKEPPTCDFSIKAEGLKITFTAVATNTDTYAWNFGDGQTSTEADPVHTYAAGPT